MVDAGTFKRPNPDEQNEYQRYSSRFIQAVRNSEAQDGFDFQERYKVFTDGEHYYLAASQDSTPFAGIKSRIRGAIEAFLTDAVQNYGR